MTGPTGPTGPKGDPGDPGSGGGAPTITIREQSGFAIAPQAFATGYCFCDANEILIGGGFRSTEPSSVFAAASYAVDTRWQVEFSNTGNGNAQGTVYAVCLMPPTVSG